MVFCHKLVELIKSQVVRTQYNFHKHCNRVMLYFYINWQTYFDIACTFIYLDYGWVNVGWVKSGWVISRWVNVGWV